MEFLSFVRKNRKDYLDGYALSLSRLLKCSQCSEKKQSGKHRGLTQQPALQEVHYIYRVIDKHPVNGRNGCDHTHQHQHLALTIGVYNRPGLYLLTFESTGNLSILKLLAL